MFTLLFLLLYIAENKLLVGFKEVDIEASKPVSSILLRYDATKPGTNSDT